MTSGLLCVISTMEPSPTFEHRGTHIIRRTRPCHVLYPYQIHPELGWMHAPDSDLVSLRHPGRPERAGVACPTDGTGRAAIRTAGELFSLDRGL